MKYDINFEEEKSIVDEMNYYVYAHINKDNCKTYIGMTDNPLKRWNNGQGYAQNKAFYEDICKYGWDGFAHSILDDCLTYDEARDMEKFFIEVLETCNPEKGYNRRVG